MRAIFVSAFKYQTIEIATDKHLHSLFISLINNIRKSACHNF
jgi:hypothetical protein